MTSEGPNAIRPLPLGASLAQDTLLGVSFSLKSALRRSAARGLLSLALDTVARVYPRVALLDLSQHQMPLFDGQLPADRRDPAISYAADCVVRSGALLLAVPAYWGGVSGAFKNFVDCVCGPSYDLPRPLHTVFSGKHVGLLIVGADAESTSAGAEQAVRTLSSTGAKIVGPAVTLSNPRGQDDRAEVPIAPIVELCVLLLREIHNEPATGRNGR